MKLLLLLIPSIAFGQVFKPEPAFGEDRAGLADAGVQEKTGFFSVAEARPARSAIICVATQMKQNWANGLQELRDRPIPDVVGMRRLGLLFVGAARLIGLEQGKLSEHGIKHQGCNSPLVRKITACLIDFTEKPGYCLEEYYSRTYREFRKDSIDMGAE